MTRLSAVIGVVVLMLSCSAAGAGPLAPVGLKQIPKVLTNIEFENEQLVYRDTSGMTFPFVSEDAAYTLSKMRTMPTGVDDGLVFDFGDTTLDGQIVYGFFHEPGEVKYNYPVFFGGPAKIENGVGKIEVIRRLSGKYDFINWQKTGLMRFGYRIINDQGHILYDGKLIVRGTGPFRVDTCLVEGPFVNLVQPTSVVISCETNFPTVVTVTADGRTFAGDSPTTKHEILIDGLEPDTDYAYTVAYGEYRDTYTYHTAPAPGSRTRFTFAYASDGRGNSGGGERDIYGVNCYILKRINVLCAQKDIRFFQFTGDLIDGYLHNTDETRLQYANWKRGIEPFACYTPYMAGFGNHEALVDVFANEHGWASIDQLPYDTRSAEVVFAEEFVNPTNGPISEDGSPYDPDPDNMDFPPYEETVFYYTYDNVAVISLNSNYWYSPSRYYTLTGGNIHAYIMDQQLAWIADVLDTLETDTSIDHVFLTVHTPIFPNGGHVKDDMWYRGNNYPRPWVAGDPVSQGIIERRDSLIAVLSNHSTKFVAALTGDEHNYSTLHVTPEMERYPATYSEQKLEDFQPFYQINNGAAGAPYYGREETPWQENLQAFSTQNAVVFFHVHGESIEVEVINPDTMEEIDRFTLR